MLRLNKEFKNFLIVALMTSCGCATIADRYKAIKFDDGINRKEAMTIAQYHIAQHPLSKEFKRKPNNTKNEDANVWSSYFNPKDYFGYIFRVNIDQKSGKIIRSGLIPKEKSQFEKVLINVLSFITEKDFIAIGLVATFYEENSRWPSNQEEIQAWIRKKSTENSGEDKNSDLSDILKQIDFLNPMAKQVEVYLPPSSTDSMYKEYLFDSKQLAKRKIILSQDGKPGAFQIRYPDLGDMVFPIKIKTTITDKKI